MNATTIHASKIHGQTLCGARSSEMRARGDVVVAPDSHTWSKPWLVARGYVFCEACLGKNYPLVS